MKNILLFCLLLSASYSFALKADSLFQRHVFSFSMTNGVSHEFLKGASGPTINEQVYGIWYHRQSQYLPGYALHIGVNYSLGITRSIRFETGLGYLLQGITVKSRVESGDFIYNQNNYTDQIYIGRLTIPLHVKFVKPMHKGAFTCTVGPDFNFDMNTVTMRNHYTINGKPQPNNTTSNSFNDYIGGLGIDLKMGYEKQLSKRLSIDIGPVVNFTNVALFGKYLKVFPVNDYSPSNRPVDYYIGFDVAFNLGLKK